MNKIRREELRRIAATIKTAQSDLAAVYAEEVKVNVKMAYNSPNKLLSNFAISTMDDTAKAVANMLDMILLAAEC